MDFILLLCIPYPPPVSSQKVPKVPKGVEKFISNKHCSHLGLGLVSSSWSPPLLLTEEWVGWEGEGATEYYWVYADGTASGETWGAVVGARHHRSQHC